MSTWFHTLFIQEPHAFFDPASTITAITEYGKNLSFEVFYVETSNLPECDEAIVKAPVSSAGLPWSNISDSNCKINT